MSEILKGIELVKKLGGAGNVLFFKEEYYLIANVYLKEDDATAFETELSNPKIAAWEEAVKTSTTRKIERA